MPWNINLSITSDRAWIRFADRPKADRGDTIGMSFVNKIVGSNPRWFSESVVALGVVHYRLCCKVGHTEKGSHRVWKRSGRPE